MECKEVWSCVLVSRREEVFVGESKGFSELSSKTKREIKIWTERIITEKIIVLRERVSNERCKNKICGFASSALWILGSAAARNRLLSRNQRRYGSSIIPCTYGPPRPLFMALPLPCGHHFYYPLTSSSSFLTR